MRAHDRYIKNETQFEAGELYFGANTLLIRRPADAVRYSLSYFLLHLFESYDGMHSLIASLWPTLMIIALYKSSCQSLAF